MNIYRLETRDGSEVVTQGTCWQLGADLLVTAYHVVGETNVGKWLQEDRPTVTYHVVGAGEASKHSLQQLDGDAKADVAVLRSCVPFPSPPPQVVIGFEVVERAEWKAAGFPSDESEQITFAMNGRVAAVHANDTDRDLQLTIEQGAFESWEGASGSPVLVGEQVVGLLTDEVVKKNTVWATRTSALRRVLERHRLGALLSVPSVKLIICLASGALEDERRALQRLIAWVNDPRRSCGQLIDLQIRDNTSAGIKKPLQNEYNTEIRESDAFVFLCHREVDELSRQELEIAFDSFRTQGRPSVHSFIKSDPATDDDRQHNESVSLTSFKARLREGGHYWSTYSTSDELLRNVELRLPTIGRDSKQGACQLETLVRLQPRSRFPNPNWRRPRLSYTEGEADAALLIEPQLPYLEESDGTEVVQGIRYWECPFDWEFPTLDVHLVNNNTKTAVITRIIANVTETVLDERPVLTVRDRTFNCVEFTNEGWGPALDCEVELEFPGTPMPQKRSFFSEISGRARIQLPSTHTGKLQRVRVEGSVCYRRGIDATAVRRTFRFKTFVYLGRPPDEAPGEPSAAYELWIEAGQLPQTVELPCSHSLAPGEHERFLLRLASRRSHTFEIHLRLSVLGGADVFLRIVRCHMFVPRSGGQAIAKNSGPTRRLAEHELNALHDCNSPYAWGFKGIDPILLSASHWLQLKVFQDLDSGDPHIRRGALDAISEGLEPTEIVCRRVLDLVTNDTDVGVIDSAMSLILSGAFSPNDAVRALSTRVHHEYESSHGSPHGIAVIQCALTLWTLLARDQDGSHGAALAQCPPDLCGKLLAYEVFFPGQSELDTLAIAKAKRYLERAAGIVDASA